MCNTRLFTAGTVVIALAFLTSAALSGPPKANDVKDAGPYSLAGRWIVTDRRDAQPESPEYYIFKEDGTYEQLVYYKEDPRTPGHVNRGVWQEEGGRLTATILHWEEPANT
jgi:hypothetical protein